jgi:hypothetical protein
VGKQKQPADDAKNIQTIRQIETLGFNSKIVFCDPHVRCPMNLRQWEHAANDGGGRCGKSISSGITSQRDIAPKASR